MTSNLSTYHIANCNYNTVPLFLLKTAVWAETSREICVFTSVTTPPLVQSIFCHGDARKVQSDFFVRKRSAERITNDVDNMEITQQTKRTREHLEIPRIAVDNQHNNSNPDEIIITATIIPHSETAEQILAGNRNAIRHDRLLDKIDRYTSHNKFMRRCLTDNIIPISYKVTVEPSIGNHDEDFLKGYYDMMDGFSKNLMEYTANYCERKISDFDKEKLTSEEELKSMISEETYAELTKALGTN